MMAVNISNATTRTSPSIVLFSSRRVAGSYSSVDRRKSSSSSTIVHLRLRQFLGTAPSLSSKLPSPSSSSPPRHHLRSFHNSRLSNSNRNKYVLTDISSKTTGQEKRHTHRNISTGRSKVDVGGLLFVVGGVGIGHIALSAASLWWSTRTNNSSSSSKKKNGEETPVRETTTTNTNTSESSVPKQQPEQCFDAHHYQYVIDYVSQIYGDCTTSSSSSSSSSSKTDGEGSSNPSELKQLDHERIILSPTLVFEDPAAKCVGPHEFKEAFRVLHSYLKPHSIYKPTLVDVQPNSQNIDLYFDLYQQYTIPSASTSTSTTKTVRLESTLVVSVQLEQTPTSLARGGESDFRIVRIEERWNSHPLFTTTTTTVVSRSRSRQPGDPNQSTDFGLCTLSRRLNGLISYQLSRRLL